MNSERSNVISVVIHREAFCLTRLKKVSVTCIGDDMSLPWRTDEELWMGLENYSYAIWFLVGVIAGSGQRWVVVYNQGSFLTLNREDFLLKRGEDISKFEIVDPLVDDKGRMSEIFGHLKKLFENPPVPV